MSNLLQIFSFGIIEKILLGLLVILFILYLTGRKVNFSNLLEYAKVIPDEEEKKERNVSEGKCREIFERLFGQKFESIRPDWLKNPETGRNLELDGFCPKIKTRYGLGLAFEYDGQQHSSYNPYFHKSKDDFVKQVRRDFYKDRVCKSKGIVLIRIPHIIAQEDFERYIKQEIKKYEPYSVLP